MQVPRPPRQVSATPPLLSLSKCLLFLLLLVVSLLVALPSALAGVLLWVRVVTLRDAREWVRGMTATAVFGVIVYGLWIWLANPLPWLWNALSFDLVRHQWTQFEQMVLLVWAFHLWLAPACGLVAVLLIPQHTVFSRGEVRLKEESQREDREEEALVAQALTHFESMLATKPLAASCEGISAASSLGVPGAQTRSQAFGSYLQGELDAWVFGGELCIPPEALELHGLVLGEPNFGKTWTLLRLAVIARLYGRRVIYLDMKGSRKTAALFLAAMSMLKVPRIKIYPFEAYDGFRGTPKALYNRMMEQIDPRTHPFYRAAVGSCILSLAVHAPQGKPPNSSAFLERINAGWLTATYATDAQAMREIQAVLPHIAGLQLVMAGFFRGIAGGLDGSWAFEDTDACYIGVDSITQKEEAALLGRYLLADAADFATSRKPEDDQVLLLIDEFGGLRSTNATDLYEKIREAGMSVYAAAQSYHALGDERDHVLAASSVKILHRCGNPKPILDYAGERERFTYSRLIGAGESDEEVLHPLANQSHDRASGHHHTVMHPQKELAVLVEDVQQLELGQIALISGGKGGFAHVHALAIPEQLVRDAVRFIATAPRFTPLAPPTRLPSAQPSRKKRKQRRKGAAGQTTATPAQGTTKQKSAAPSAPAQATVSGNEPSTGHQGASPAAPQSQQQISPTPTSGSSPLSTGQTDVQKSDDDASIDFFQ